MKNNGEQGNGGEEPPVNEDAEVTEPLTQKNIADASFTPESGVGKNGVVLNIPNVVQTTVGMGKEELMKYANEPFWIRLRMTLFVLFWVLWIGMLIGAVVIIILAPRCPPAPKVEWYQKSAVYQVDVETFKDSNGDGVGDFKGLASKLDYFKDQHIDALMLSAFYKSSSSGDILDHNDVDSKFGTVADFDDLVNQLHEKNIRLVIDFNPNHSSDEHPWFLASVEGQEPYKDFYVWADPSAGNQRPNNWLNVNGESAWRYNANRKQFYLDTFGDHSPELNLRNPLVRQELRDIVKFWMEKGVDGFKVVAASHLVEDKALRDEPLGTSGQTFKRQYKDINHIYTVDQPENLGLFAEWKEILKNFTESSGISKILAPELSGTMNASMLYYGTEAAPLADLPFNDHFAEVDDTTTPTELKEHLNMWMDHMPAIGWPTLLVGGKSIARLASRVGADLVDAIHMVAIFAKGTPITYYADELGIADFIPKGDTTSTSQTVMIWTNASYGGFTNSSSSLHVHPSYETMNVEVQEKNKQSHLKIFSRLMALRGQPALNFGVQEYPVITNETFSLMRVRKGSPGYLVVVNLGDAASQIDFTGKSKNLPEMARVEVRSNNILTGPLSEGEHPKVALNDVKLEPKQAVVFSFVPVFEG